MLVLAAESSCDETAVALVEDGRVLSSAVYSQVARHAPFGGIVPDIAARMHIETVAEVARRAFEEAERTPDQVDAVAATYAPGLVNCLVVGLSWARAFAVARGLPFLAVDHLEAHVYGCLMSPLGDPLDPDKVELPLVALLVSGGHTAIYRYEGPGRMTRLARTVDDAAGEAFDKVAVLLGLGYPGGPEIERAAREGDPKAFDFPRGRIKRRPLDFSFSGLKTAVLYATRGQNKKRDDPLLPGLSIPDVAASFQESVCRTLIDHAVKATLEQDVATLALAGGVARNGRLRELALAAGDKKGLDIVLCDPAYCTDNAAMIGGLACARLAGGEAPDRGQLALGASSKSQVG
ncbi:MAG TPA: tRNA (adenosine(37)-N6)-threonylcarbamoyltransferase complex transferase subunit TsaD [Planctomycetes bacterium]|nr:tRNA (adenosine(37)-N6)-threonylcarbamoyltransferase complex transferase subunit TsaD [Planctomycetota bacterium]